ncbi:hypothetical protein [Salegentibacter salinarum]|uniref:hypothetical protein n=1 Tax=Salegentibacter salinarum TaxID=447422 RepID=UPI001179FE1A|nr:hypothetical protein [Salegentibacter salinarum]
MSRIVLSNLVNDSVNISRIKDTLSRYDLADEALKASCHPDFLKPTIGKWWIFCNSYYVCCGSRFSLRFATTTPIFLSIKT